MKNRIKTIIKFSFLFLLGIVLLSYDNVKNHGTINEIIVEGFINRNNGAPGTIAKFKNYIFWLDREELKGDFILKPGGLFHPSDVPNIGDRSIRGYNTTITEEQRSITPLNWIIHGGFSADEPEVPAGLRHFYDPIKPPGNRFLNDTASSVVSGWGQTWYENPKIDGVSWALGKKNLVGVKEHNYSWENGKKYMQAALEEKNPDKRKNYMAKAWRSLGETLHMIADNGCPPHVRNDSHPPGNVAPYENILTNVDLKKYKTGKVDQKLLKDFRKKENTAFNIAHKLAVYTNENFFSSETIAGTDVKLRKVKYITHPHDEYKSPKITPLDYDNGYYIKTIAEQPVKVCTDKWFFSKYGFSGSQPYIDDECTYSMAGVLIPTIKEAGINVMRIYIPEFILTITNLDEDGNISGNIVHKTDQEYKNQIYYNGPVEIKNSGTKKLVTLNASEGKFEGKISGADTKVFAEIEFGGINIRSDIKTRKSKSLPPEKKKADKMKISVVIYAFANYDRGFKDDQQTFINNTYHAWEAIGDWQEFTVTRAPKFKGSNKYGEIEGEMNEDEIVWLKIKWHEEWEKGSFGSSTLTREEWWNAELVNIPLDPVDVGGDHSYGKSYYLEGWDFDKERPNPQFEKCLKKLEHEMIFYPSKEKAVLKQIDFTKSQVRTHEQLISFNGMQQPRPFIRIGVSYNVY
ncbi:hypothetical protein [uncultured Draconibacterium sp.]|uniref:hypothetical protein n=1 Tax=uncultured Draconibacterium sp. TaxID=1573823 RepID=UPI0029C7802B|nr:hypothetical protein [uncultured Draconibacterium sp.]